MKRRANTGFTLLEVVFALLIFGAMSVIFAAVLPGAQRAGQMTRNSHQGATLAARKLEQLRHAGYDRLQSASALAGLGLIDAGSASAATVPYTATFTGVDGVTPGLLPSGSAGQISVRDYHALNASAPIGAAAWVTVTVQWRGAASSPGSFSVSGLVAEMPHD